MLDAAGKKVSLLVWQANKELLEKMQSIANAASSMVTQWQKERLLCRVRKSQWTSLTDVKISSQQWPDLPMKLIEPTWRYLIS